MGSTAMEPTTGTGERSIEEVADSVSVGERVQVVAVDPDFFEVMGAALRSGRRFGSGDLGANSRVVIVNESFVRALLGGGNAVGRRIRYSSSSGAQSPSSSDEAPWLEIVGVVEDLAMATDPTLQHNAGVYHPRHPADSYPVQMAVHLGIDADEFAGRLRELARETSTAIRVHHSMSMDGAGQGVRAVYAFFFRLLFLSGGLALLLTIAGIYAVLALTVSRRTREIGVRVALGAGRSSIVAAVLSRMTPWVTLGAFLGTVLGLRLAYLFAEVPWQNTLESWGQVALYLVLMMAAGLLPCAAPIRRALAIEPSQAVAAEL